MDKSNRIVEELIKKWENTRVAGLFCLALVFGVVLNIGSMVFYDLFIKGNFILQLLFLWLAAIILVAILTILWFADKKREQFEQELKKMGKTDF